MTAATAETAQTPVAASRMYGTYADMGMSHMSTIMPASQRTANMVMAMGATMGGNGLRFAANARPVAMPATHTDWADDDGFLAGHVRSSGSVVQRSISADGHRSSVS